MVEAVEPVRIQIGRRSKTMMRARHLEELLVAAVLAGPFAPAMAWAESAWEQRSQRFHPGGPGKTAARRLLASQVLPATAGAAGLQHLSMGLLLASLLLAECQADQLLLQVVERFLTAAAGLEGQVAVVQYPLWVDEAVETWVSQVSLAPHGYHFLHGSPMMGLGALSEGPDHFSVTS